MQIPYTVSSHFLTTHEKPNDKINISKHDSCLAMGRKKINKGRENKNGVQQTGAAAYFLYVSLQKVCRLPLKLRTKYWPLHKQKHRDIVTFFGVTAPRWVRAYLFTRFLDHTQRRSTVSRTRSSSHRPLPDNTQFETTISAGERSQAYAL
jgi:hypothetical protein